ARRLPRRRARGPGLSLVERAAAWCLYPGTGHERGRLAELVREEIELAGPGEGELLVEPLYGSWEGNMHHALLRDPVDVCKQRGADEVPAPWVFGWGGGTTLAELDLARRRGCRAAMLSGTSAHLAEIERAGVAAIDRRKFGDLRWREREAGEDPELRRAYQKA